MKPYILYGVPFSQPVRAVMWTMLYKRLPFEMILTNPGSSGDNGGAGGTGRYQRGSAVNGHHQECQQGSHGCTERSPGIDPVKPNTLLITADQWCGDCLSSMGHPVVKTPHLDALADESVHFRRHYTNVVPCGTSRASLHTGLYLHNHRSGTNGTPLDSRFTNWALEARNAGYDPVLFGYTHTSPSIATSPT